MSVEAASEPPHSNTFARRGAIRSASMHAGSSRRRPELDPALAASFPHRPGGVVGRFCDDRHGCGGLRVVFRDRDLAVRAGPAVNGGSRRAWCEIRWASSRSPEQILRRSYDLVRLEPELPLQLLKGRRRPKRVHADDAPRRADVSLPSKGTSPSSAYRHHGRSGCVRVIQRSNA
jgi:hypothetical protein